jgi:hypothetical protein
MRISSLILSCILTCDLCITSPSEDWISTPGSSSGHHKTPSQIAVFTDLSTVAQLGVHRDWKIGLLPREVEIKPSNLVSMWFLWSLGNFLANDKNTDG